MGEDINYVKVKFFLDNYDQNGNPIYYYGILAKEVREAAIKNTHPLYSEIGSHLDFASNDENGRKPLNGVGHIEGNTIKGKQLIGLEYEPLFDVPALQSEKSYKIYPADFVTTTDGTGVVHTAVMYGEDDYALGKKIGLPEKIPLTKKGNLRMM